MYKEFGFSKLYVATSSLALLRNRKTNNKNLGAIFSRVWKNDRKLKKKNRNQPVVIVL